MTMLDGLMSWDPPPDHDHDARDLLGLLGAAIMVVVALVLVAFGAGTMVGGEGVCIRQGQDAPEVWRSTP